MVYFNADWARSGAVPHWKTRNHSFVKVAYQFKELGVENFAFHLALYDKSLEDVDPHDPTLEPEVIAKVVIECKRNPWYFFREVARVPEQGGEPVMFVANRANIAQIWLAMLDTSQLDIIPRQNGKTITALELVGMYTYIFTAKFDVGLMTKDTRLLHENIARIKDLRDCLPPYFHKKGNSFNNNNMETISYYPDEKKRVEVRTWVANAERKRADGHGRGGTFVLIVVDEFAHCVNIKHSMNSMIPACSTSFQNARKNGMPCSIILITTPGYTKDEAGEYAFNFRGRTVRFTEGMYDFENKDVLKEYVKRHSNGYVLVEYPADMLGKDEEWFDFMRTQMDREEYLRDVMLKWMHGSMVGAIEQKKLDRIKQHVKTPLFLQEKEGLTLRWFVPKDQIVTLRTRPMLLGMDNSDNRGRDGTTLVFTCPRTLEVLMTMHCNQDNMMYVINLVVQLLKEYKNTLYIPEKNRAATFLDILFLKLEEEGLNPFTRVFNMFVHEKGNPHGHDITMGSVKGQFGFNTSKRSRQQLYKEALNIVVDKAYDKINDYDIWEELSNLIKVKGRVDHAPGGHDDLTIAYLLCVWFTLFGKNIEHYGFIPSDMAAEVTSFSEGDRAILDHLHKKHAMLTMELERPNLPMALRRKFQFKLDQVARALELHEDTELDVISIHQGVEKNYRNNLHQQNKMQNLIRLRG